jgi:hypothetical protein
MGIGAKDAKSDVRRESRNEGRYHLSKGREIGFIVCSLGQG